jgi:hypothetical protein
MVNIALGDGLISRARCAFSGAKTDRIQLDGIARFVHKLQGSHSARTLVDDDIRVQHSASGNQTFVE